MTENKGNSGNKEPKSELVTDITVSKDIGTDGKFILNVVVLSKNSFVKFKPVKLFEKRNNQLYLLEQIDTDKNGEITFPFVFTSPEMHFCIRCGNKSEFHTFKLSDAKQDQKMPEKLKGHWFKTIFAGIWEGRKP